ncbi:hypothetical protein DAEQUDRAFT_768457 [Daedalea quercina L-15889]|uniref:BTB domain-containing protein n=1 Tax=Daedalea quercina L-15889 TaxID=1314783 RepID=A0A165MPY3_9APHY|nr:hypothetical protein DAEQUDRAFT_768457 [Daedalea quercina L-15889]
MDPIPHIPPSAKKNKKAAKKAKKGGSVSMVSIPTPIPRNSTKEEVFLTVLRSGIAEGNLLDTKLYTYTRRTPVGVDMPRPVYANEAALTNVSDYFVTLFQWDFQEGRMSTDDYDYMSDSDLEDAEEDDNSNGWVSTHGLQTATLASLQKSPADGAAEVGDGTEETITAEVPTPAVTVDVGHHVVTVERPVVLETVAFKTFHAFVFWTLTGKVSFAPLRSQSSSAHLQYESKSRKPFDPPACSPKSMFRFAHMCGISELKKLALNDIVSKLAPDNVLTELFSSLTARYTEVLEAEVEALVKKGLTQAVLSEMPHWMAKVATGSLGTQSGDVIAMLLQRLSRDLGSSSNGWY